MDASIPFGIVERRLARRHCREVLGETCSCGDWKMRAGLSGRGDSIRGRRCEPRVAPVLLSLLAFVSSGFATVAGGRWIDDNAAQHLCWHDRLLTHLTRLVARRQPVGTTRLIDAGIARA